MFYAIITIAGSTPFVSPQSNMRLNNPGQLGKPAPRDRPAPTKTTPLPCAICATNTSGACMADLSSSADLLQATAKAMIRRETSGLMAPSVRLRNHSSQPRMLTVQKALSILPCSIIRNNQITWGFLPSYSDSGKPLWSKLYESNPLRGKPHRSPSGPDKL